MVSSRRFGLAVCVDNDYISRHQPYVGPQGSEEMFDFLKVAVKDQKKKTLAPVAAGSVIKIDSRSFPLLDMNKKGFVAGNHQHAVVVGQLVSLSVVVEEAWGKFSFSTKAEIQNLAPDGKFSGGWSTVLLPEADNAIQVYMKNRKAAPVKAR